MDSDELRNLITGIAHEVMGRSQFKGTIVTTAYNPQIHAIKGIIQPHGIESGWVPIASLHVGNGFGIVIGPRVGSADELDGQVFDLHMDGGDPDTLVAHHRQFSDVEKPPVVQSGEMLVKHASGTQDMYFNDGSRKMTHATGATETWDPQGNLITSTAVNRLLDAAGVKHDTAKEIITGATHLASSIG